MSRRSCIERSRSNSPGSSVIGVSSRSRAHCSREKMRYGLYCCSGARISMTRLRLLWVALARGLLFEPGHGRALRQGCLDVLKLHAARLQEHQQVEQQIRAFGDQVVAIVLDRGDHGFHRLLAQFLGAMLGTPIQQLARIGRLASRRRAGVDGGGKIVDRETRHQLTLTRPQHWSAIPMWDLALL